MNVDRENAAASLSEIDIAEQKIFRAVFYGRSGAILILWGLAIAAGYGVTQFHPALATWVWPAVWALGYAGMFVLLRFGKRLPMQVHGDLQWRLVSAQAALIAFACLILWLLGPLDARQMTAFWPLVFMLGYVLAGIWVGPFFIVCGIAVAALICIGYMLSGPWFALWMAAANGGALVLGGLWLRQVGARP